MGRLFFLFAIVFPLGADADWRDRANFSLLQEYAGANLPNGSNVTAGQVEAGDDYMPDDCLPPFNGITINNLSNSSDDHSGHARDVGYRFYGNNFSVTPATPTINVRSATDFINNFLGISGSVASSSDPIISHAYVFASDESTFSEIQVRELVKRMDFFAQDSQVLNVIGMSNVWAGDIPPGWGATYNTLSVGRTTAQNSYGPTPEGYENPGRQKPDIVAEEIVVSYATGALASAALLLTSEAQTQNNSAATHPDTIKAALMAGATHHNLSGWEQTTQQPLDDRFGAGEVDLFRSYRIIENTEFSPGTTAHRGWSRSNTKAESTGIFGSPAVTRTYTFTVPSTLLDPGLTTTLIWQRPVSEFGTTYTYQALADLKLELLDESNNILRTSNSPIDNVEHLWVPTLTPGATYSLRVSSASTTLTEFSLAWLTSGKPAINASITKNPGSNDLTLTQLFPGTEYKIERSTDLTDWTTIKTFTSASPEETQTDPTPPTSDGIFYRLRYFHP